MNTSDLSKVTIQIFRLGNPIGDSYDVIPHGSGVLLEKNGGVYLISAAHNFDQEDLKKLGFLNKKAEFKIFQGDLSRFPTTNPVNMPADIAVYRLTEETIKELIEDDFRMISLNNIILNRNYDQNGKLHLFGYPASQSKKIHKERKIYRKPFHYISRVKHIPRLKNYDALINLPIDWHHRKLRSSSNLRVHSCKPAGLSGCGLWCEINEELKLVGIMISYNTRHSFLMGTTIDLATEIIRIKFDSSMPKTNLIKLKAQ